MKKMTSRPQPAGSSEKIAKVVAFMPSLGKGGGIERYCEWLFEALEEGGSRVARVALLRAGEALSIWRKARFILEAIRVGRRAKRAGPAIAIVAHPGLGFAALVAMRIARFAPRDSFVFYYGTDAWSLGRIEQRILRRSRLRPVTISAFSAGALVSEDNAAVVEPGLQRGWFTTLLEMPRPAESETGPLLNVLSVFRLAEAHGKGLPTLLEAVRALEPVHSCRLTIAGSGALPRDLQEEIDRRPGVKVISDPSDTELAALYAQADVVVLATRTTHSGPLAGEGFGIVLVEAQLVGTPVIGPAFGGSDAAYLRGVTGLRPADESTEALTRVLAKLAGDPLSLHRMGHNAKVWAMAAFDPDRRSAEAQQLLLGAVESTGPDLLPVRIGETGSKAGSAERDS